MKLKVTRNVTTKECPWLDETISEGAEVFKYTGYDYGCISSSGTAVGLKDGETPFFEIPTDALSEIETGEEKQPDNLVEESHWREVCKIGEGADCCKYLTAGADGFCCEKNTGLGRILDKRTDMTAKSDNCSGAPQFFRSVN